MPCLDGLSSCGGSCGSEPESSVIVEKPSNNEENGPCDSCPPLCNCACCGYTVLPIYNEIATQNYLVEPIQNNFSIVQDINIQAFVPIIWQPPRLS